MAKYCIQFKNYHNQEAKTLLKYSLITFYIINKDI